MSGEQAVVEWATPGWYCQLPLCGGAQCGRRGNVTWQARGMVTGLEGALISGGSACVGF